MGKLLVVCRLAVKDLRRRTAQAILLLLAIAAGATTLALGLALRGTTNNPYARTRAATRGPDVVAAVFPNGSGGPGPATSARPGGSGGPSGPGSADVGGLVALEHTAGVAAHSGPFPVTWTLLRAGHTTGSAEVEGRSTAPSSVDRPKLLQGTWVRPGGVVVEAAFADALGLHVGDRLSLGGSSFEVTRTAVTAAIPAYPDTCSHPGCFLANSISSSNPGLVWATQADASHIARAATSTPLAYFLNLKLNDPAGASAFADRYNANASPTAPLLYSWQRIRDGDAQVPAEVQLVLFTGSWLLALLALASVVVLVGGRMAEQTRRVGLLKAVGGTPPLVAVVLLFEHVLVGLCAAAVGLLPDGWRHRCSTNRGQASWAPRARPVTHRPHRQPGGRAGSRRGDRGDVRARDSCRPPEHGCRAGRLSPDSTAWGSGDQTLGALAGAAPPRRPACGSPAAATAAERVQRRRHRRRTRGRAGFACDCSGLVPRFPSGPGDHHHLGHARHPGRRQRRLHRLATALDARHPAALAPALGATPAQITTGLSVAQLLPALTGALLGIPGGIGIYDAAKNGPGPTTIPPALWLAVMVAGTLLAVAALTAIPARIVARRPVAEVLQAEAA